MYDVFTFEWDDRKAHDNYLKHGVDFEEVRTVFYDKHNLVVHDPDHSVNEERFLIFGISEHNRSLVVSHTYNEKEILIRIISAREISKKERKELLKYWG